MALNKQKGNMYKDVDYTWNTVKGECYHNCSYCYMKNRGKLNPVRFDEKELKTNLGTGTRIFVGSSNDLFADEIPDEWIERTLEHCRKFDNEYLFQSKNPARFRHFQYPEKSILGTTIETNWHLPKIMRNAPAPPLRARAFRRIQHPVKWITIEPILKFDLTRLVRLCRICGPVQVNIGAATRSHGLLEPNASEILELITALSEFTKVVKKENLKKLLKESG